MRTKLLFPLLAAVIASGQIPSIAMTSAGTAVTNAASFQPGIAPGGIVTIFGTNLGAASGQTLIAPGSPWPQQLGGTSVTMNGATAPIYYVLNQNGSEQISVQAPWSFNGMNSATVIVSTTAGASAPVTVPVLASQPGIFLLDAAGSCATHVSTGAIVTQANPAMAGEYVTIYLTGLGAVQNEPVNGTPALSTASTSLVNTEVFVDSVYAQVSYAGLAPGYIGLYQVNFMVPQAAGVQNVTVQVGPLIVNGGILTSNVGKIVVQGSCSYNYCGTAPQLRPHQ
jgi:uncharacterized protein (TIGR03437 family)